MVKFKDFLRVFESFISTFQGQHFIFKDFSRKSCIFKYFSSLCEPCFLIANGTDPDKMPHYVSSHRGLHHLGLDERKPVFGG